MKVTTDGCLFGAIVAKELRQVGACKVLDIGTGTGLLSLMLAQQNAKAIIDAVEIDRVAAMQAKENIDASFWSDRITVLQDDILKYKSSGLYDVIISNPPFYEQQLSSPSKERELAHHSSELTLQQLFQQVNKRIKANGQILLLLPFYRAEEAISLAGKLGLSVEKQWLIKQTPKHSFFRTVFCFKPGKMDSKAVAEITIKDEAGKYTNTFAELLSSFYLKL